MYYSLYLYIISYICYILLWHILFLISFVLLHNSNILTYKQKEQEENLGFHCLEDKTQCPKHGIQSSS